VSDGLFIDEAVREFQRIKTLAEKALAQVDDRDFTASPRPIDNSLAIIVKHVAGNLKSRWTDFLTTDGEKRDRRRDTEFELAADDTRQSLMARWEDGWARLFEALRDARTVDPTRTVTIRGEAHTIVRAVNRQMSHYAYHAGQIALLARHYAGDRWNTLSIPRGQSEAFNEKMRIPHP
jgi:hypothetical protein